MHVITVAVGRVALATHQIAIDFIHIPKVKHFKHFLQVISLVCYWNMK